MPKPGLTNAATYNLCLGRVVRGHRVASGANGNVRFPGGTLRMQWPHFAALGLDLSAFAPQVGTLNVSIAPNRFRIGKPRYTFENVAWHPTEPAETFSFIDCEITVVGKGEFTGFIYYPHPETKPEHFQPPDVLELLVPLIEGIDYGTPLTLVVPTGQMEILPS